MAKKKNVKIDGKRVRSFNEVLVGDWIFLKMRDGSELIYKGFITSINSYDDAKGHFIGFYNELGVWVNSKKNFTLYPDSNNYSIYAEKEYTVKDFGFEERRHLIDVALMTNDIEWFKELTQ